MTGDQLTELVTRWQARLGLEHWRVVVRLEDTVMVGERRVFARTQRSEYFDRATLTFDKTIIETGKLEDCIEADLLHAGTVSMERFIEETVVHELLHMSLRNIMETGDIIREELTRSEADVWDKAWRRAEEELCERTAIALVTAFGECNPQPEEPHGSQEEKEPVRRKASQPVRSRRRT